MLTPVLLPRGMVLHRHDTNPEHVYFPRRGVVSLSSVLNNGDCGEVAIVGNEGVVGVGLMMDSESPPMRAVVQSPGEAWAMCATTLRNEFLAGGELQFLLLRYTRALMAQMAQVSLCTRRHRVAQQACRWLLFAFDRAGGDELQVTHEAIAEALGVRREGITEALGKLQEPGGIRCTRGRIQLLDYHALVACTCECYGVVRGEYQRLLETDLPAPAQPLPRATPHAPAQRRHPAGARLELTDY